MLILDSLLSKDLTTVAVGAGEEREVSMKHPHADYKLTLAL